MNTTFETASAGGDEDEQQWRESVRAFLSRQWPVEAVHALMDGGPLDSRALYAAEQGLGVAGLTLPEARGGAGAPTSYLAVALQEMAGVLYAGPCLAVSLATTVVGGLAGDRADTLLAELLDGALPAVSAQLGGREARLPSLRARHGRGAWRLSGSVAHLLGHQPDLLLVSAGTDDGRGLFVVRPDAAGVSVREDLGLDVTRPLVNAVLDDAEAELVGLADPGWDADALLAGCGSYFVAAESVGVARACVRAASAYAADRVQFGRPIGQYQGVKHRCADMLVRAAGAEAALRVAGEKLEEALACRGQLSAEVSAAISVAKVYGCGAAYRGALDNLHIHGGSGFLWGNDAHLYVRRSVLAAAVFGDERTHLAGLAASLVPETDLEAVR